MAAAVLFLFSFLYQGLADGTGSVRAADLPGTQSTQALVRAAEAGDLHRVTGLLQAGADPNVVDTDWNSPLIFAARDGHLGMVRALVRAGALVNWQDGEKVTPLILAAFKNHLVVAEYLLAHGADPFIIDKWQRRALDYALRRGRNDPIARLLHRAEINWPRQRNEDGVPKARDGK